MTILGLSEAALIMIQDILESRGNYCALEIVNNMKIFPTKQYIHSHFTIELKEHWSPDLDGYVVGAMQPETKKRIVECFNEVSKEEYISLRHEKSTLSKMSIIGKGVLIDAGAVISAYAEIGNFATIYTNAVISHHCKLGEYVTICPSASLAGNVDVGEGTMIGIGAVVKNGVKIGSNCLIGAGSVVVKDIPDNSVVKGNPAK